MFLILTAQTSFGQTTGNGQPTSECSGFNSFLGGSMDSLMYYATSVSPSGLIQFDLTKSSELSGVEELYPFLGVDAASTFTLVKTTQSRLNADLNHFKYQQYHKDLKVVGGGYTVSALSPDEPGDPCAVAYMMAPNIYSGINVSENPSVLSSQLDGILQPDGAVEHELAFALNLEGNCGYRLVWETLYEKNGPKQSWVDAQTGTVLKTIDTYAHNIAPTVNYGQQDLDDTFEGGVHSLVSGDGNVSSAPGSPTAVAAFGTLVVPTNNDPDPDAPWTAAQAAPGVYQSHFVTTSVLPALADADIEFESIDVAFDNTFIDNARSSNDGDQASVRAYFRFGQTAVGNRPVATHDVAGHELCHAYLFDYLNDLSQIGVLTLHEAISDMVGTYAESDVQAGATDWVMGDDDAAVQALDTDRDLENPNFDCWNVATQALTNWYPRGGPLRRWFFLMTEGDATASINGLGLNKAMTIVLEAVNYLDNTDDVDEFAEATVGATYSHYGPCSDEADAVRAAWAEVCITIPAVNCNFSIVGPQSVCEEDDQLTMFISGGAGSTADYVWYFPYGWTVPGSSGNSYYGSVLYVTDFPKYNWYPKYFTITVKLLGAGGPDKKINVKLTDCLGDDPTCEEYYGLQGGGADDRSAISNQADLNAQTTGYEIDNVKVFDITGRLLFEGSVDELSRKRISYPGLLVFAYFDGFNNFVRAEKMTINR